MTDVGAAYPRRLLERPASWPLVCTLAGFGAAVAGLAAALALVLLVWAAEPGPTASAGAASAFAVRLWLWAHHLPLALPRGSIGLTPLGLFALPAALLFSAGRVAARYLEPVTWLDVTLGAGCVAAPYALFACAVAGACAPPRPPGYAIALASGLLALLAAGAGAASVTRPLAPTGAAAAALRTGAAVLGALVAAGTLLVVGAVAAHAGAVLTRGGSLRTGLVGGVALVALQLALAPNAVVAGVAYLLGPGFAVGSGTVVSPARVHLGRLPALPLLGALPHRGSAGAQLLALLVVLGAGVGGGLLLAHRTRGLSPLRTALAALWVAAGVSAALAAFAALAGGPVDGGRLAAVGASPAAVGLLALAQLAPTAMLAALAAGHGRGALPSRLPAPAVRLPAVRLPDRLRTLLQRVRPPR